MNFEMVASLVLASLASVGKPKAIEWLQGIFEQSEANYKAIVYAANAGVIHLKKLAEGSKTILDDQALDAIQDILRTSAEQNGLKL